MFRGTITALVTPFTKNGAVNYEKLTALIEFQIQNGAEGLVLLGTTGEAPTLDAQERAEILRVGCAAVAGRVPLMAGCASNDTADAARRARALSAFDVDALLVLTPYYNKANDDGMTAHFETVADASEKPIYLYHVPSRTGCRLSLRVLGRLRRHPNIVGIKEASGDISYLSEAAALSDSHFSVLCGNDELTLPAMALGAEGVVSVVSNIAPRAMRELTDSCLAGDAGRARQRQRAMLPLIRALFSEVNPIPVKAAMRALGCDVGDCRLPLGKMEASHQTALLSVLRDQRALLDALP